MNFLEGIELEIQRESSQRVNMYVEVSCRFMNSYDMKYEQNLDSRNA